MTFEKNHENYNIIQRYRLESEEELKNLLNDHNKSKEEVEALNKRVNKTQEELDQLNRTLNQVDEYNQQMKSEIAITRRTTYRAEEEVISKEKSKK